MAVWATGLRVPVDPTTWKLVRIRATETWDDGTVDDINVETLQSPEWIATFEATVGSQVPMPLDLVEMGVDPNLYGRIVGIEPCPPIHSGPGRVVLTTVNHLNNDVYELTIRNAVGHVETVSPTRLHRLFRSTDSEWVAVHDLDVGDEIHSLGEPVTLLAMNKLEGV